VRGRCHVHMNRKAMFILPCPCPCCVNKLVFVRWLIPLP
jgi:predicted transporter